jgi:integrase/recombinase XerD
VAQRRLPEFLRPAESDALIAAATRARDRLILLVSIGAGLRVSEMVHLRIEHVDTGASTVFVSQGKGKKDRYVAIPRWLCDALRQWIGKRCTGWVFPSPRNEGRPITTRAVQYMVAKVTGAAELTKHVHPHTLRHSYATALLRSGADLTEIQQLMGHAHLATTALYLHCDVSRLSGTVAKLSAPPAGDPMAPNRSDDTGPRLPVPPRC